MPNKTLIITAIIMAVIAVGATATYITLRQEGEEVKKEEGVVTPEEPTTTEPIDTSDWKTYTNEGYGFAFKYPSDWTLRKGTDRDRLPDYGLLSGKPSVGLIVDPFIRISLGNRNCADVGKLDPFYYANLLLGGRMKEFSVSGFTGVVFRRGCYECYEGNPQLGTKGVVAVITNSIESGYFIILAEGPEDNTFKEIEDLFINQFLSTVKLDQRFDTLKCSFSE